jgi:hypothetical protein
VGDRGKLLLISDLEGCFSTEIKPQSQVLCGEEFFTNLKTFLSKNPENKVAFLGDYFDQGLMVVDSINRIMDLYGNYPNRVIIILGNRDINKLRFIYEMDVVPRKSTMLKWNGWTKLYNELPTKTNLYDRVMLILKASMGAPADKPQPQIDEELSKEKATEILSQIDKKDNESVEELSKEEATDILNKTDKKDNKLVKGLSKEEAAYVLVRAFSKPAADRLSQTKNDDDTLILDKNVKDILDTKYSTFFKNVRKLFMVGKIVSYDNDYKVLLSHAGGAEPFLLHTHDYYDNIRTAIKDTNLTYYDKIEKVRQMLQEKPEQTVNTFKAETYNEPLVNFRSLWNPENQQTDDAISDDDIPLDFFLLQGLGLKPDLSKHFNSFIQSCDIVPGCKGPYHTNIIMDPPLDYTVFLRQLQDSNIEFIAHGHIPICIPVPLIYKRPESNIIFVANDTSNGYRPAIIENVNQVPLAYITKDGKAGVFSLPGSTEHTYKDVFKPMVQEWTKDRVPTFIPEENKVNYTTHKLTFPGLITQYAAAKMETINTTGGAKRTTKKARKTRKCCRRKSHKKRMTKTSIN